MRHALDGGGAVTLDVPESRLGAGALIASAGLIGFGLVLWIAANWDGLGRFERFGLAATVIAAGSLVALLRSALAAPGMVLAFAGTGGLLALIGQTYQTGADPWQLFALWAALCLPWAVAARSDALWTPWAIVAMTAVVLWSQAQPGGWPEPLAFARARLDVPRFLDIPLAVLATWLISAGVAVLMAPFELLDRWLGQRRWAFRASVSLTMLTIGSIAIAALFWGSQTELATYLAGVAALAAIGAGLVRARRLDIYLISATALGVNTTLVFGFARLIVPWNRSAGWGDMFLVGLVAAGLIAASVVGIMRLIPGGGTAGGQGASDARRDLDLARPWPVVLLSGIGAIFAAVPLLTALGVFLGPALQKGAATYIVALIAIPAAMHFIRRSDGLFAEQLSLVGLAVGVMLLQWGIARDLPIGMAGLLSAAIATGLAFALGKVWLASLLGAAATAGVAVALNQTMKSMLGWSATGLLAIEWSLLAVAGIGLF
jgi:hypothetical protein